MIIDLVGEVGYDILFKDVKDAIDAAITKDEPISINLFSYGGSYYEGVAIYDYIKDKDVTIKIYGMAASAAACISAGAGKGKLFISESAALLIHQARIGLMGYIGQNDFDDEKGNLVKINDTIADIFAKRTGIDIDAIKEMVLNEKSFTSKEALELGFVDGIISEPKDMDNKFIDKVNIAINKYNNKLEDNSNDNKSDIENKTKLNNIIINNNEIAEMENDKQTQMPIVDNSEALKIALAKNKELEIQVQDNKHTAALQAKEKENMELKNQVETFQAAEQERINKIVDLTHANTIKNINTAGLELTDDMTNSINECKDVTISNTLNDITRLYEEKISNMRTPDDSTQAPPIGEKFAPTTNTIVDISNEVEIEKMIDKLIKDDVDGKSFGNDTLKAFNYLIDNKFIKEN